MDLEELEKLIAEYLDTLDTDEDYHWEGCTLSERGMAQIFLVRDHSRMSTIFLMRDHSTLTSGFLTWLKARNSQETEG